MLQTLAAHLFNNVILCKGQAGKPANQAQYGSTWTFAQKRFFAGTGFSTILRTQNCADGFWMSKTLTIFYQSHKICGFWKVELPPFHKSWPETRWQTLSSPQTHGSTPCSAKSDAAWAKVPKIPENYWPLNSPNIWCILPMAPFCSIEILLSSQKSLKTVHRR